MTTLQAALCGSSDHPAVPRTPDEIAADAAACVLAGANLLHLHAYDDDGNESLAAEHVGRVLRAVRAACPGTLVNVTTFAEIEPDPERRFALVSEWSELPDLVAANQGEDGIDALSEMLARRGVGIEACLLSLDDAHRFVRSTGIAGFARVVVEPLLDDPDAAVALDAEIEGVLATAGVTLEQLHHGVGAASWRVVERAARRGHGIRVGLEDLSTLPDGSRATMNAELVRAAVAMTAVP
ncbi:3-keto-5-aminohexanoate cleavage protein [Actinomycetospora aeridis]|uniref:3-keto-5-aminohexanoate cleavage protein n=1 Tax=Actinomycetospora aeridis TaxID=3129231 RepID=A0ABU8NAP2_9PSEU